MQDGTPNRTLRDTASLVAAGRGAPAAADDGVAARLATHVCRLRSRGLAASPLGPGYCPSDAGGAACGANPTVLVNTGLAQLGGVAVDDQYVYWANVTNKKLSRAPLATPKVITDVLGGLVSPTDVAADGTYVYVADTVDGGSKESRLLRVNADGGAPSLMNTVTNSVQNALGLAVIGSTAYYASLVNQKLSVGKLPTNGGSPSAFAGPFSDAGLPGGGLGASSDGVYLARTGLDQKGAITFVPLDGGARDLATGEAATADVAGDAWFAYWTATSNTIRRAPMDGGPATTFVSSTGTPVSIAIDARCVYWTVQGTSGAIYMQAR
jgi:hypothetical protein